ncbi:GPR1/FUN34/yaaH family protein [Taphrina deformans PYCC 5710]|uniref:GPR1/FUN34/yaaH family protein n=1 Tax=Taphrina deformans (strain PYCC 5710 / ATCC 11124 / CBS 356.35 / IMI 108563 / JCM 9778 / NBRC 8474) TaxID=1097556 RepID=R4XHC5_TAPDE|nr:GPR1/FUN34/yaaH family protein [Taphrina deformans PYCC 5710]|eukprot:CCG85162.1 GPR1/FUN34/yaaH family protein [Taphrina deformans PYCC 5710]
MRKFIDSQVKSKDERLAEKEASRVERDQRRAAKEAEREEQQRQEAATLQASGGGPYVYGAYGQPIARYGTGNTILPGSGAEFDAAPHHRHFSDRRLANPAPLGLFAFSFSTFLLGLVNLRTQGVTETTALVGPFLMYSGLMMSITAIFELISGNTFGATAFGTFAGFFLSLGAIILPSFGTYTAFSTQPLLIFNFLGLFFATWLIPFGIFCFLTIRSTWTLWLQFIAIFASLALSCAQYLKQNDPTLKKAAGALLIVVSFFGYLNGSAGLMAKETVFFQPPVLQMPWSSDKMVAGVKGPDHPHNTATRTTYKAA